MQTVFLHGFATTPEIWQGYAPEVSFADLTAESQRLAGKLSPETTLIGWSMGGMIAMRMAVLVPEKISRLILVSTTPKFIQSPDFPFAISKALLLNMKRKIKSEGIGFFHKFVFKILPPKGLAGLTWEQAKKELEELKKVNLRNILPEIKVPTLIIHGTKDEICLPAAAHYMHEKISGSELVILEGVGHAPMIEVPEKFKALIC